MNFKDKIYISEVDNDCYDGAESSRGGYKIAQIVMMEHKYYVRGSRLIQRLL